MKVTTRHLIRTINVLVVLSLLVFGMAVASPAKAAGAYAFTEWSEMTSGTSNLLYHVWGTSGCNVYAVGANGTILHYNGRAWSVMDSGTTVPLYGIWGNSANDIFAVGDAGTILHFNGTAWSSMTTDFGNFFFSVWGSSGSDVYAVGTGGAIYHYNGTAWSAVSSTGTTAALWGIWGSSASDIFAVGEGGAVVHFDGTSWTAMNSGTAQFFEGVWGSSANNVYAVGSSTNISHYTGTWNNSVISTYALDIWGSSDSNVFAVGGGTSAISRYNGSAWIGMHSPADSAAYNLWGVWGPCPTEAFAVGEFGHILHYGGGCSVCPTSASIGTNLGTVNFTTDIGSINDLTHLRVADTRCSTPSGYDFPYGLFSFKINDLNLGQTVQVIIKFPRHLPTNVKYYKCINGKMVDCTRIMTRLNDYTLALNITDGGFGDADGLVNGTIVDPGGPAEQVAAAQVYGQGTIPAVTQQAPVALPAISVKSASLSATKVTPGTPVTVTADVANTGTSNGTTSIKVYVNGQEESSQGVTVSSGGSTPLTFTVSRNEPGTYTVYVGGTNAGSFTVDWLADSNIIIISVIAILFAFAIGVIYMTRRKQAH